MNRKETERYCHRCNNLKNKDQFSLYVNGSYSKHCKSCNIVDPKPVIFKDGKLNTNQSRNFNWLLGYCMPKRK